MTKEITVLYNKTKDAKVPVKPDEDNYAYDVYSSQGTLIPPMTFKSVIIPTDFKTAFDADQFGMKVSLRSGVSAKTPLVMSNSPGIIEGSYRKGLGIIVRNAFIDNRLVSFAIDEEGSKIKIGNIPTEVLNKARKFYEEEMKLLELQPTVDVDKMIYRTLVPAGTVYVAKNRRIAQMHFQERIDADFVYTTDLPKSVRGETGFGDSGTT